MIGTSHSHRGTSIGSYLLKNGYTLRELNHNHPNGNPLPSGKIILNNDGTYKYTNDLCVANELLSKNKNAKLNIYTKQYGYSPYNDVGTLDKRFGYLDPIEIIEKR